MLALAYLPGANADGVRQDSLEKRGLGSFTFASRTEAAPRAHGHNYGDNGQPDFR